LEKNVKSQYLRDRFTDFDEIWQVDANWLLTRLLKFRIFENLIWRRLPFLKSQKNAKSQQRMADFRKIWHFGAKWVS